MRSGKRRPTTSSTILSMIRRVLNFAALSAAMASLLPTASGGSAAAAFSSAAAVRPPLRAIMSDIDGTLVHYEKDFARHGVRIVSCDEAAQTATVEGPDGDVRTCRLLPSSTMGPAVISDRTVELVEELRRDHGVIFCVVTAARRSTAERRLPDLPPCDAVVSEGGSRVVVDGVLDLEYASAFEDVCGPMDRDTVGEDGRPEPLWRYYRKLRDGIPGLKLDANDYFGMFRASALGDETTEAALQRMVQPDEMPDGVSANTNLGKIDFFPAGAGKANAVRHLLKRFGIDRSETACLFDDDNDLQMAEECGGARMLPSLTSHSVRRAADENPGWYLPRTVGQGVFATEECLEVLLERAKSERRREEDVESLLEEVDSALLPLGSPASSEAASNK